MVALPMKAQARTGSAPKRPGARRAHAADDHGGDTAMLGDMALELTASGLLKRTDGLPTRSGDFSVGAATQLLVGQA